MSLKSWWNRITGKEARELLEAQLTEMRVQRALLEQQALDAARQADLATVQADALRAEIATAAQRSIRPLDPRVTIVSSGITESGTTHIELDWNDDFIANLRNAGYVGDDEEDMVNQWLNQLLSARTGRPLPGQGTISNDISALESEINSGREYQQ
jgi:hypothetical protein